MQFYGGTNSGFASGLAGFGQAIGSAMQRYKDKEQKKKDKLQTENSLISMGLDPEVAKGISGDPSLLSAYRLAQQKEYQDQMVALEKQKMVQDAMPSFAEQQKLMKTKQEDQISHDFLTSTDFKGQYPSAMMYDSERKDEPGYATNYLKFVKDNAETGKETALGNFMDAGGDIDALRNLEPKQVALFSRVGGKLSSLTELASFGQRQKEFQANQEDEEFVPKYEVQTTPDGRKVLVARTSKKSGTVSLLDDGTGRKPVSIQESDELAELVTRAQKAKSKGKPIDARDVVKLQKLLAEETKIGFDKFGDASLPSYTMFGETLRELLED